MLNLFNGKRRTASDEHFSRGMQELRGLQMDLLKFLEIKEQEVLARQVRSLPGAVGVDADPDSNPGAWLA